MALNIKKLESRWEEQMNALPEPQRTMHSAWWELGKVVDRLEKMANRLHAIGEFTLDQQAKELEHQVDEIRKTLFVDGKHNEITVEDED